MDMKDEPLVKGVRRGVGAGATTPRKAKAAPSYLCATASSRQRLRPQGSSQQGPQPVTARNRTSSSPAGAKKKLGVKKKKAAIAAAGAEDAEREEALQRRREEEEELSLRQRLEELEVAGKVRVSAVEMERRLLVQAKKLKVLEWSRAVEEEEGRQRLELRQQELEIRADLWQMAAYDKRCATDAAQLEQQRRSVEREAARMEALREDFYNSRQQHLEKREEQLREREERLYSYSPSPSPRRRSSTPLPAAADPTPSPSPNNPLRQWSPAETPVERSSVPRQEPVVSAEDSAVFGESPTEYTKAEEQLQEKERSRSPQPLGGAVFQDASQEVREPSSPPLQVPDHTASPQRALIPSHASSATAATADVAAGTQVQVLAPVYSATPRDAETPTRVFDPVQRHVLEAAAPYLSATTPKPDPATHIPPPVTQPQPVVPAHAASPVLGVPAWCGHTPSPPRPWCAPGARTPSYPPAVEMEGVWSQGRMTPVPPETSPAPPLPPPVPPLPEGDDESEACTENEVRVQAFSSLAWQQHKCIETCCRYLGVQPPTSPAVLKLALQQAVNFPANAAPLPPLRPSDPDTLNVPKLQGVAEPGIRSLSWRPTPAQEASLRTLIRRQHHTLLELAAECEAMGIGTDGLDDLLENTTIS